MKLEQQVTNLELSKKLKELGVKQESLFYWTYEHRGSNTEFNDDYEWEIEFIAHEILDGIENCSAFTVAELGEMLPDIYASGSVHFFEKPRSYKCWDNHDGAPLELGQYAETEADARAKMLIYLLENKLINNLCQNHQLSNQKK